MDKAIDGAWVMRGDSIEVATVVLSVQCTEVAIRQAARSELLNPIMGEELLKIIRMRIPSPYCFAIIDKLLQHVFMYNNGTAKIHHLGWDTYVLRLFY